MDRLQIKTNAKAQLGNSLFSNWWLNAVLFCFILNLLTSAVSALPFIGALALAGPIIYAGMKQFLFVARGGGQINVSDILDGFGDDFLGNALIWLMTNIFIFLWSLLFIIPGIVKSYAYSFAYYIKADHPEYDWHACLNESKRLTQGHKGELFILDLSFIGWYILGALALGIGTLWVMPYHMTAKANAYLAISALADTPAEPAAPVNQWQYNG